MAVMTVDINVARGLHVGNGLRQLICGVTGPSTYTTGGDSLAASSVRLGFIEFVAPFVITDGTNAAVGHYNNATQKLQFFWQNPSDASAGEGMKEVTNGTNLSTYVGRMMVVGK